MGMRTVIEVKGMHCKSCKALIESELSYLGCVENAMASIEESKVEVDMDPDCTEEAIRVIKELGYSAKVKK